MQVVKSAQEMRAAAARLNEPGKSVGFVPTMGALHEGHLSLVRKCRQENDFCVVSIFVNPMQFNDKSDLKNYPRDLQRDLGLLEKEKVDFVFAPTEKEIYPHGTNADVKPPAVAETLEGKFRPGHFAGVCAVVKRLFEIVSPGKAYFGHKDYQQFLVVKEMVRAHSLPVTVVVCPTVREKDGLALSSRNARLDARERKAATVLFRALNAGKEKILAGEKSPAEVEGFAKGFFGKEPLAKPEYFAVRDAKDLSELKEIRGGAVLLCACRIGKTRLIDNLAVSVPA
ncbi:MAG: pantoate--beta-alanine ligase [Candidatus Diapherotrites archaeon]|nr:pantoate--beta-alanine ligase [Candidatus Diapherotrites archaeon]